MIRVAAYDTTGKRLRIDFDPGESGVAALIAVAAEMHQELVSRMMRHAMLLVECPCDECRYTKQLQQRLEGYFVKGL